MSSNPSSALQRLGPQKRALVLTVALAAILLAGRACNERPSRSGTTATTSSPIQTAADGKVNSADQLVFWIDHRHFVTMTDAELQQWKDRGVDGFVSVVQWLKGMGGMQDFTPDPHATLEGESFTYQRQLRDTRIVDRAKSLGMTTYLGFYFANQTGGATPLKDWFDDDGWSQVVLPQIKELAATAKALKFSGLAFDQELYPQAGNVQQASWSFGYAGNTRTETETREKARQRGAELMSAIVDAFPDVEIVAYGTRFPESWEELVQDEVNEIPGAMASDLMIDIWEGIAGTRGYRSIVLLDAIFYKTTQMQDADWDSALQYNANRAYSLMSRRWDGWEYASSRVHVAPFAWIDEGTTAFEAARSPDYVLEQLLAFRKWGAGRLLGNFAYSVASFDYGPYVKAMREASAPGVVDAEPPTVAGVSHRTEDGEVTLTGKATDNLAVRAVRWQVVDGPSGAAKMTWKVKGGDYSSGWDWEMEWVAEGISVKSGQNQILVTIEDIKGLTASTTVTVTV